MSGDMPDRPCPEPSAAPRDDRSGYERPRDVQRCACGRVALLRGQCAWALHGLLADEHPDGAA